MTDLDSEDPSIFFSISDNEDSTGAGRAAQAIGRPQNIAKRTLRWAEDSGSLFAPNASGQITSRIQPRWSRID